MKILLVDDHPPIRRALRTVLELEKGLRVVGEAETVEETLQLMARLEPEMVILDLRLRGGESGIELCREIKSSPDAPYVVLYTAHNSPEEVAYCRLSGADSYVHKSEDETVLLNVIESVRAGDGQWLLGTEVEEAKISLKVSREQVGFTDREQEIFVLLLKRYTNPDIARELHISLDTVKTHTRKVLRKLGVSNRRGLF